MKKVLLLTVMCVLGLFGVRAQETSFFYDFNEGSLDGWRVFQEEGATSPNWAIGGDDWIEEGYHYGTDLSLCIYSASYIDGEEFVPMNYIVTTQPYAITSESVLSWYIRHTYPSGVSCDSYAVVVSEDGENFEQIWNSTAELNANKEVSLAEYAGKNLYIGFYHYLTNGIAGDAICLDDIKLEGGAGDDNTGEEGDDNTGEEGDDNTGEEGDDNTGEDEEFLICERFENYEVGDKVAEKGNECWTTWSKKVGGAEDGVIVDLDGNKCVYLEKGNDQVIKLGGYAAGSFELEFDVLVPEGNSGYYNILHNFAGGNSVWAMQGYFHMTDDGSADQVDAPGHGTIHAGGNSAADMTCIYDAWMHLRFIIDINNDLATLYTTFPEAEEVKVVEWQWSKDSFDENTAPNRKLDAMNFWPPVETSAFYLDNFTLKQISAAAPPTIDLDKELNASADVDDITSVEVTIENTGLAIADYTAWVDYGVSEGGSGVSFVNYDAELNDNTTATALSMDEPTLVEVGAMYPGSAYASSVAGTKITHVSYLFLAFEEGNYGIVEGSDVVFRIYGQGTNDKPGEVLAEKTVPYSEIKPAEFLKAKLDEPVVLTGFNVWATVTFMHNINTDSTMACPLVFDGQGDKLVPYGDLIRFGNEGPFYFANKEFQSKYGNFHIRMTCSGEPVLGGWAEIDGKVYGTLQVGETAKMNVNLSTFGLKKGETYEAKLVVKVDNAESLFEAPLTLYVWAEDVEEILSNTYNVYPNPTTGMVTVEGENINYIAVYNSVGQLVKVVMTQDNVVDMSAYENGVYFFNIVDNAGQNSVQRVVVAK